MRLTHAIKELVPVSTRRTLLSTIKRVANFTSGIRSGSLPHDSIVKLLAKPDPVIFEIGCNDGKDTLEFLKRFPSSRLFCVEPDARAVERFKHNLGNAISRVSFFELALTDRSGWVDFYKSNGKEGSPTEGWDCSGSVRIPKNHLKKHPWVKFDEIVSTRTTTLDRI